MESNYPKNIIKQIRTANGPKQKENFTKLVLPYEHICQNLCEFLLKTNSTSDEEISLKNYSDVMTNKYSYLKNLYLESDTTKASDELSLLKDFRCNLIIDATTRKNGQNTKALREISKLSQIDICFGYTLKEDFFIEKSFNFDKILNEIRYELAYGYEDLIPSFLGEIIISESKSFPNENEDKLFEILFKVIEEFKIPIFIKLNYDSLNSEYNIFQYFQKKISQFKFNKNLLVFIYGINSEDCKNESSINFIKNEILSNGFSLIITTYECDNVLANKIKENKFDEIKHLENIENFNLIDYFFEKEKLKFIINLLDEKKFLSQIMISNNVNFRIQLKKYGGFGYVNLFKNYFDKIITNANLNDDEVSMIFNDNLINLVAWWEPPKQNEKKVKMIICSNCENEKEDTTDIFRKFEFVYCSVKCLRLHSTKKK